MIGSASTATDALDSLVSQFSSTLDCYRELVQNSIDAGSPTVDIWMEYTPGSSFEGTIAIHVNDYGEGMDEAIIDGQLTKLFASSKENDLTKIGKFGIGFVSVFALRPQAVLVHTGRGGEYWEILFHADRTFTKIRVDTPVEGTQLTIFVASDRQRYNTLVSDTRATLAKWCRHSETEITFEDRSDPESLSLGPQPINEPFVVTGACMTTAQTQGTEIVLAFNTEPTQGFYNKGLTLLETNDAAAALGQDAERFRQISFKIKSRYLEHTLSRETVMRDQNYEKAVALLIAAADGPLYAGLLAEIEQLAVRDRPSLIERDRYMLLMDYLCGEPFELLLAAVDRPILRLLHGGTLSLDEANANARLDGRLFVSSQRSSVTEMLRDQEVPVILGRLPPRRQRSLDQLLAEEDSLRASEPVRSLLLGYLAYRERRTLFGCGTARLAAARQLRVDQRHPRAGDQRARAAVSVAAVRSAARRRAWIRLTQRS